MRRRSRPAIERGKVVAAVSLALAALAGGRPPGAAAAGSSCEICHSEIAVAYRGSAHAQAEITCTDCHGGNPSDPEASAMASGAGFKGRPERRRVPEFCGSCHSDRAEMAEYGLPTHQLDDYKQSLHGKAWQQGDTKVAVCTDCHGRHRILGEKDPRSTVSRKRVAETCARCHSDAALMSQYRLPATALQEYLASVHARATESGAREAAPTCSTCHAGHAALPPQERDIPNVCSRCHGLVKDLAKAGPHREAVARGVMSCVSCHGYHGVAAAADRQLLSSCGSCHQRFSAEAEIGDRLYAALATSAQRYQWARETVDWLEQNGVFVQDLRGRLAEANMGLLQGRSDQHALDPAVVEKDLVITESVVDAVWEEMRRFQTSASVRRAGLGLYWCYTAVLLLLLHWQRRRSVEGPD